MRGIDGLGVATEVLEDPFNDGWRLDAGDDPEPAAALPAGLDVDGEHPLEALRPGEAPLAVGGRWFAALGCSHGSPQRNAAMGAIMSSPPPGSAALLVCTENGHPNPLHR